MFEIGKKTTSFLSNFLNIKKKIKLSDGTREKLIRKVAKDEEDADRRATAYVKQKQTWETKQRIIIDFFVIVLMCDTES